jgi:hypothetical protein
MTARRLLPLGCLLIGIACAAPARAQAPELTEASRARLLEMLSLSCGSAGEELRFRLAIGAAGAAAEPLLLEVLERGAPAAVRARLESEAARRYERRQAWMARNGARVFGDEARRIAALPQADYVSDALRRADALYRQNAMRALAMTGGARTGRKAQ